MLRVCQPHRLRPDPTSKVLHEPAASQRRCAPTPLIVSANGKPSLVRASVCDVRQQKPKKYPSCHVTCNWCSFRPFSLSLGLFAELHPFRLVRLRDAIRRMLDEPNQNWMRSSNCNVHHPCRPAQDLNNPLCCSIGTAVAWCGRNSPGRYVFFSKAFSSMLFKTSSSLQFKTSSSSSTPPKKP